MRNSRIEFFYGRRLNITLEVVQSAFINKEITKIEEMKVYDSGEGLNISIGARKSKGNQNGNKSKSKSKSNGV